MPGKKALAIRHVFFEDLGTLAPVLRKLEYEIEYCDVGTVNLAQVDFRRPDLVVVLGGPIGCYDTQSYPFLVSEIAAIRARLAIGAPTLGICLGAQLIATALGAAVYPAAIKEIGWAPVALTNDGRDSAIGHLGDGGTVLHWHGDTFDLPAGATLLASTTHVRNQAFSVGRNVLALQFHPEFDVRAREQWLVGHAHELSANGIDVWGLRSGMIENGTSLERRAHLVFEEWISSLDHGPRAPTATPIR